MVGKDLHLLSCFVGRFAVDRFTQVRVLSTPCVHTTPPTITNPSELLGNRCRDDLPSGRQTLGHEVDTLPSERQKSQRDHEAAGNAHLGKQARQLVTTTSNRATVLNLIHLNSPFWDG